MQGGTSTVPSFKTFKPKLALSSSGTNTSSRILPLKEADHRRSKYKPVPPRSSTSSGPCGELKSKYHDRQTLSHELLEVCEIDRKGDARNVQYGSLDQHAVPTYRRFSHKKILGITYSHAYEIVGGSNQREIVVNSIHHVQKAPLSQSRLALDQGSPEEPLFRTSPKLEPLYAEDFLSFSPDMNELDSAAGTMDPADHDALLFLPDQAEAKDRSDQRLSPSKGIQIEGISFQPQMNPYLSRADGKDVGSAEVWLKHLEGSTDNDDSLTGINSVARLTERKRRAEIRLSICERGLRQVVDRTAMEMLLICLLQEGRLVWEDRKVEKKWKGCLHPDRPRLWLHYADYVKTNSAEFHVDKMRQVYLECLHHCRSIGSRKGAATDLIADAQVTELWSLLHDTICMLEAGHTELAISIWQSIFGHSFEELRQVDTSRLQHDKDEITSIEPFEAFWESECLRFGEIGDRDSTAGLVRPEPSSNGGGGKAGESGRRLGYYARWASSERAEALRSFLPARTADDGEYDDPYRVVLFSDVKPFLFALNMSNVTSRDVVNVYLQFFGLPVMHGCRMNQAGISSAIAPAIAQLSAWMKPDLALPLDISINNLVVDQHTIFSSNGWPSALRCLNAWCDSTLAARFLLHSLESLVIAGIGGDELAEYALSIELRISPKTVRGKAKKFLKSMPSSMRLYNVLALIEFRLGDLKKAQVILIKSLKLMRQMGLEAQTQSILLWRTLLWELLKNGRRDMALEGLLWLDRENDMPSDFLNGAEESRAGEAVGPKAIEQRLRARCDYLLHNDQAQFATVAVECLMLYAYMRTLNGLGSAVDVFHEYHPQVQHRDVEANEALHQSLAHLIYFHMSTAQIMKLVQIRDLLQELIDAFPLNTIFMSMYAYNEGRLRVDDRLHSHVQEMVCRSEKTLGENIVFYSFLADLEIRRHKNGLATTHSVRNTFERALISPVCAHCANFWRSYIEFEIGEREARLVAQVLLRAVQACPWVKEFYLLAFEHCDGSDGIAQADLKGLYALLEERGLRVRQSNEP